MSREYTVLDLITVMSYVEAITLHPSDLMRLLRYDEDRHFIDVATDYATIKQGTVCHIAGKPCTVAFTIGKGNILITLDKVETFSKPIKWSDQLNINEIEDIDKFLKLKAFW